ncbi:MAG: metallophosphoesterase, partial [Halioglobus sp.]
MSNTNTGFPMIRNLQKKTLKIGGLAALSSVVALTGCSDGNDNAPGMVAMPPPAPCSGSESALERLYLQQLTDTSVIIKWRGDATGACIGTDMAALETYVEATSTDGDHKEVVFTGLMAENRYYYSVGGAASAPEDQWFQTNPAPGALPADGNTRIWLIGDSGTGGDDEREDHEGEAVEVREGMETFVAADGEAIDLFIMLGDNAYEIGSDFNYQQAVFETYPEQLKQTSVWPTIGNHEMGLFGVSSSADPDSWIARPGDDPIRMPYLDIFSLPQNAEAGGVASGTEQYYSFDHGNVHVVSLDSQLSARDAGQRATMRSWLIDDLSSNTSDWTVVIFH